MVSFTRKSNGQVFTAEELNAIYDAVEATETVVAGKADAVHTHGIADLTATGTRSTSTFLRGDNTFATPTNTTYTLATQAEVENAASTTARLVSGQRLAQAVAMHAPVKTADLSAKRDKSDNATVYMGTNFTLDTTGGTVTPLSLTIPSGQTWFIRFHLVAYTAFGGAANQGIFFGLAGTGVSSSNPKAIRGLARNATTGAFLEYGTNVINLGGYTTNIYGNFFGEYVEIFTMVASAAGGTISIQAKAGSADVTRIDAGSFVEGVRIL